MICYRDMTFCKESTCESRGMCPRFLTDQIRKNAEESGLPIASYGSPPSCFVPPPPHECQVLFHLEKEDANGDTEYTNNPDEATGYSVYLRVQGEADGSFEIEEEESWKTEEEAEVYAKSLAEKYHTTVEYY